jgi:hypothetical protein
MSAEGQKQPKSGHSYGEQESALVVVGYRAIGLGRHDCERMGMRQK